jgi:DNA mismatch repair protein MutS2
VSAALQVLPKGSVTIATSQTGSTLYMEPKPVIAMNNVAAELEAEEEREELRVLASLSRLVALEKDRIVTAMQAIVSLDLANARASHAKCVLRAPLPQHAGLLSSSVYSLAHGMVFSSGGGGPC